ncbi:MAG TPA: sigma-54 dependent transcriptional regulator [bacterium]
MTTSRSSVLVVDDEENILKTVGICLESIGLDTHLFSNSMEALESLNNTAYDLALIDLKMAPMDGMEMLSRIRAASPDTTVVIVTAHGSIDSAVEAIKKGAYHYLQKPFEFKELQIFVQNALQHHRLTREIQVLKERLREERAGGRFLTRNKDMMDVLQLAKQVADSPLSVLIEGESGTGKELVAQTIHEQSERRDKPFVRVNCAALPAELLESELFGHVKGAFTGAVRDRQGRFELADGGTVFLDEIAEIAPSVQVKLLRVLQSKEFERVGDSATRKVDVRIIAATNRDLNQALKAGAFREDLFYRLNAVRIKTFPLRDRPEDIPLLVEHFIQKASGGIPVTVSPDAMKAIRTYRWNGNARELEHAIERAVLLSKNKAIELEHLPGEIRDSFEKPSVVLTLEEMEKTHIRRVLDYAKGYEDAASILGIDPATLWRKRKKYGL